MTATANSNIVPFPTRACRGPRACPHCGTQTDFWRFGRLLWGYCAEHEVRWVAADYGAPQPVSADRARLRRNLEFLSGFAEITLR